MTSNWQSGRVGACSLLAVGLVLAGASGPVRADEASAVPVTVSSAPAAEAAKSRVWTAASDDHLARLRGGMLSIGDDVAVASLESEVSDNQVGAGVTTGAVGLADSAISDVRGIFVGTFNTGNNAAVQTNLNVVVRLD